jgi:hypothetical protein
MKNSILSMALMFLLCVPARASANGDPHSVNEDPFFAVFDYPAITASCSELLQHQHVNELVYLFFVKALHLGQGDVSSELAEAILNSFSAFSYPALDFAFLERLFRQRGLPIHLVARRPPPGALCVSVRDCNSPVGYMAAIHLNNEEAARREKEALGLTDEQNLELLSQSGFLVLEQVEPKRKWRHWWARLFGKR